VQNKIDFRRLDRELKGVKSAKTTGAFYFLPSLILAHHANTVIEIGIEYGYTTALISGTLAQLFPKSVMLSVDKSPRGLSCGTKILAEHPTVNSMVLRETSGDVDYGARLRELGTRSAGLIYIDGDHSREGVLADIDATLPVLARDGLFVFHDYIKRDGFGVADAIYERFGDCAEWNIYIMRVPEGMPFAIVQRHMEPV